MQSAGSFAEMIDLCGGGRVSREATFPGGGGMKRGTWP